MPSSTAQVLDLLKGAPKSGMGLRVLRVDGNSPFEVPNRCLDVDLAEGRSQIEISAGIAGLNPLGSLVVPDGFLQAPFRSYQHGPQVFMSGRELRFNRYRSPEMPDSPVGVVVFVESDPKIVMGYFVVGS